MKRRVSGVHAAALVDVTKYGSQDYQILFIVYDPGRAISDDRDFAEILKCLQTIAVLAMHLLMKQEIGDSNSRRN